MSKKTALKSVRFTIEERGVIAQSAAAQGITFSEYVRRALDRVKAIDAEQTDRAKQAQPKKGKRRG